MLIIWANIKSGREWAGMKWMSLATVFAEPMVVKY